MWKFLLQKYSIILLIVTVCNSKRVLNLNGEWLFQDSSSKYKHLQAFVPGGIYTDLMNNKVIDDIFYGYNDANTNWVPRLNWTYYRYFIVDSDFILAEHLNLIFDGLDTISTVFINDVEVGRGSNMFVQYVINIKEQLKVGNNRIDVFFQSPIEAAKLAAEKQNKIYSIPPNCPPQAYNGECHVNMLRKMQSSFSWDWGPSFPSVGIWKDVLIEAFNQSAIRYLTTYVTEGDSIWLLNIDTYLANNSRKKVSGKLMFKLDMILFNFTKEIVVNEKCNEFDEVLVSSQIEVSQASVNTWWPNGYGSHDLYPLTVIFSDENELEMDFKTVRVGFRTFQLVEDSLETGLSFYFKVNHIPIFMKGSNQIPIDILPERGQSKTKTKELLYAAHDSHMNMLRVWGGGVYESDYFYDTADELGILIWQDFMFACALYPSTADYLNNVRGEVRHQVKRLMSHPSIIVFSGNNENEGALANNWYNTKANITLYKQDYIKLYVETIKNEVDRITHNKSLFITSSPTNGKESVKEGYIAFQPGSEYYGDVHYYNYLLDPFNSNLYPIPRFSSEYGYQSLPSIESLLTATKNYSDLDFDGKFMNHRQHHPLGNGEMILLMNYQFQLPNKSNSVLFTEVVVYFSQIYQAMAVKIETERYRSFRSRTDRTNKGLTMGALYWQLNDVWVAPSWSSIDYTGKWKMLQYFTQNFFAPLILTGSVNLLEEMELYIVSDILSPISNVTITLQLYNWNYFEVLANDTLLVDVEPNSAKLMKKVDLVHYLVEHKCGTLLAAKENCFFYFTIQKEGVKIAPDNFLVPNTFKSANLHVANVQLSSVIAISPESIFQIDLTTDYIAAFVWMDSHQITGKFSENGFMQITKIKQIFFYAAQNISLDILRQHLTVTNLKDKRYFS